MTDLSTLNRKVSSLMGRRDKIEEDLERVQCEKESIKKDRQYHVQAREVVREVALATQRQLAFHIEDTVTHALQSVFNDDYTFGLKFVENRNRTECELYLTDKEGNNVKPMDACGGGVVDICSFALRLASWSMDAGRTRPIMILDEPFRYLSTDLIESAGAMLSELSDKLNLQIIMITHENTLASIGDKSFTVSKTNKGRSAVTVL